MEQQQQHERIRLGWIASWISGAASRQGHLRGHLLTSWQPFFFIQRENRQVMIGLKRCRCRNSCVSCHMKKSSNFFQQVFGFTDFAETCNGRLAMLGMFIAGIREKATDKGIFEQLGVVDKQEQCRIFVYLLSVFLILVTIHYLGKQKNEHNSEC